MIIEEHVTSLVLSKRLNELKIKQPSYFAWFYIPSLNRWEVNKQIYDIGLPAYISTEIGLLLPPMISVVRTESSNCWFPYYEKNLFNFNSRIALGAIEGTTEVNCKAKILIYLIENGLVKITE